MKKLYMFIIHYDYPFKGWSVIHARNLREARRDHKYYSRTYRCGPINKIYVEAVTK